MKPGHGNRDCRGWPRVSNKVQSLRATPVTNTGAGAAPTMVTGNPALRGADVIRVNTRGCHEQACALQLGTAECFQCSNAGLEIGGIAATLHV